MRLLKYLKMAEKKLGRRPGQYERGCPITEIDDSLVGKRIWYFHPTQGVSSVFVTGIYHTIGHHRRDRYGLYYDRPNKAGKAVTNCLWVKDYNLFPTRTGCEQWVNAMLRKSNADRHINMALGLE